MKEICELNRPQQVRFPREHQWAGAHLGDITMGQAVT